MPSLEGPRAKLDRAREHLGALRHEVDAFLDRDPYVSVRETDSENGDYVWRMEVHRTAPVRLGILIGDVVHNLRSSLDHLAWQLALIRTDSPRQSTEFPIFIDAKSGPGKEGFEPKGREKIRDLPDDAQKLIEAVQPYSPDAAARGLLWLLHKMSNTDKHRIILAPLAAFGGVGIPISHDAPRGSIILETSELDHGSELLRIPRESLRYLDEHGEPTFIFRIGINIPDIVRRRDILTALSLIEKMITNELLPQFERFF
jgi:hypothetical protein